MAPKPLCTYRGHTADVLDLSWSRNYFILSSGMDRTVKLWHLSRPECLCCFQHMDFVTCIAFMPKVCASFLGDFILARVTPCFIYTKVTVSSTEHDEFHPAY